MEYNSLRYVASLVFDHDARCNMPFEKEPNKEMQEGRKRKV